MVGPVISQDNLYADKLAVAERVNGEYMEKNNGNLVIYHFILIGVKWFKIKNLFCNTSGTVRVWVATNRRMTIMRSTLETSLQMVLSIECWLNVLALKQEFTLMKQSPMTEMKLLPCQNIRNSTLTSTCLLVGQSKRGWGVLCRVQTLLAVCENSA